MRVLGILLALVFVGLCTAGAFALRIVSRIWLRHLLEREPAGSAIAEHYLARPQRLHAAAGAATAVGALLGGAIAASAPLPFASTLWTVATFTLLCVVGIAIPRGVARRFPTQLVPVGLPVLRAADVVLTPLRVVAERTAGSPIAPHDPASGAEPVPRTELEDLLREGQLEGVGEETELAIISGVVQFGGKRAGDVMTPREQLYALDIEMPAPALVRAVAASGYSRVPVYRGTIDDVVGLVLAFDVLQTGGDATPRVHPVFLAGRDVPCTQMLTRMLRAGLHLAVVRDANGSTCGIVTLDDLLEELVGDIRDEHDEPGPVDVEGPTGPLAEVVARGTRPVDRGPEATL